MEAKLNFLEILWLLYRVYYNSNLRLRLLEWSSAKLQSCRLLTRDYKQCYYQLVSDKNASVKASHFTFLNSFGMNRYDL